MTGTAQSEAFPCPGYFLAVIGALRLSPFMDAAWRGYDPALRC